MSATILFPSQVMQETFIFDRTRWQTCLPGTNSRTAPAACGLILYLDFNVELAFQLCGGFSDARAMDIKDICNQFCH